MNKRIVASLYKKEIIDILRDKKTMLMMIVVPLVLYPLLFVGTMMLMKSMMNASTEKSYTVALDMTKDPAAMKSIFEEKGKEREYSFEFMTPEAGSSDKEMLEEGLIDVYITESVSDDRPYYNICYMASETDSRTAAGMADDVLSDYRTELTSSIIKEMSLSEDEILKPIKYVYKDFSSNEQNVGYIIGMIVPFLMIVSVLMGALYPAIDTTAGEKERGTLETMLTLPVSNRELITAKFLAVSTIAVGAALLNLFSMGALTVYTADTMNLAGSSSLQAASFIPALFITLLCVATFAMFASAVSLCVCIRAGSFKEAQNLSTPVMIVFMMAGMSTMIPNLELNTVTALIPIVNISLLINSLFRFDYDAGLILMVLVSNIAYSCLAVVFMSEIFAAEDVLFGDPSSSVKLLNRRDDIKKGGMPGIGDLILLFSVLLLVVLFAGGVFVLHLGAPGLMIEQGLIFLCPVAYAWYIKADMKKLFSVKAPTLKGIAGSLLAFGGTWILMMYLASLLTYLFPDQVVQNNNLTEIWEKSSLPIIIISSALFPAICEETAFRGFMLGTLKSRLTPAKAVIITGVLFGVYHMSLLQSIAVGVLGILLAYIVSHEKSIFLSIGIHFMNNLAAVLISQYEEEVSAYMPYLDKSWVKFGLFIAAVVMLILGLFILNGRKREKTAE